MKLRQDINTLERERKGEIKKKVKYKVLDNTCRIREKGISTFIKELKQRLQAEAVNIEP